MKVRERVLKAARGLAAKHPDRPISIADVARAAKVSWPTARRHLGGQDELARLIGRARPEEDAADTRARLLTAAARTFARAGFAGATLDDVAAEAGLSKGAVYWYFDSKRALLVALADAYSIEPGGDPALYVELLAQSRDPDVAAALARARKTSARRLAALWSTGPEVPEPLLALLADGLTIGGLIERDADLDQVAAQARALVSRKPPA